jgi:hypothetical protein
MTEESRKTRFPNLAGVARAIDKLSFETEDDAKKFLETEVTGVSAKRNAIMKKARERLGHHAEALDELSSELDALDRALGDNSGSRPTEG